MPIIMVQEQSRRLLLLILDSPPFPSVCIIIRKNQFLCYSFYSNHGVHIIGYGGDI